MRHSYFLNILLKTKLLVIIISGVSIISERLYSQQTPAISSDLPEITLPSPTVASLMKFEEIPVNNYTGIPDISIPIYSVESQSKDIKLNLSLNYHPASIAVDERAGYTGLGWSLFAGGTISRSVRGLPDETEYIQLNNLLGSPIGRGIYSEENQFYQYMQAGINQNLFARFIWDSYEKGKYDTEHDLYQFNFMGRTGRFYVKQTSAGVLEVQKLDTYIEKVEVIYNYNGSPGALQNKYNITGFVIFDDNGYKYTFDIVEISSSTTFTSTKFFNTAMGTHFSNSAVPEHPTAFHLSKIEDVNEANNAPLMSFEYLEILEKETDFTRTGTSIYPASMQAQVISHINDPWNPKPYIGVPPEDIQTSFTKTIKTKKITRIIVTNKAEITFTMGTGRQDHNILNTSTARYLSSIVVKNSSLEIVKTVRFNYEYSSSVPNKKRMLLKSVWDYGDQVLSSAPLIHNLFYVKNTLKSGESAAKDPWGYYTTTSNYTTNSTSDPVFCRTDVLQKMSLPTGGCMIFDFESNEFSYVGSNILNNFSNNRLNSAALIDEKTYFIPEATNTQEGCVTVSIPQIACGDYSIAEVLVYPESPLLDNNLPVMAQHQFRLRKNGISVSTIQGCYESNPNCYRTIQNISSGQYQMCLQKLNLDGVTITGTVRIIVVFKKSSALQFIYGGGVRIGKIGYFDTDVSQNYYTEGDNIIPSREKKFNYKEDSSEFEPPVHPICLPFHTPITKSSGSLVMPIPVNESHETINVKIIPNDPISTLSIIKTTDFNYAKTVRTQGADVGYKRVIVSETGNGKEVFTYNSPVDYPESSAIYMSYPALPTSNIEYKRGLIQEKKIISEDDKVLEVTNYIYQYDDFIENSGFRTFSVNGCPISQLYDYAFDDHSICLLSNSCEWKIQCDPLSYISRPHISEAYGWSKLVSKITKNYFYGGSNENIVEIMETFDYYNNNKKLREHTITNSQGEVLKTNYYYDENHANRNRIGVIKKIENRRDNNLLETKEINYVNTFIGNSAYLPQTISVSKAANTPEVRLRYISYDQYSNPLEIKQENGISIVYLWGYNKSFPIAKIENTTYAQLTGALGTTNISEANLSAINNLRNNTVFSNSMITTYTYKPLVGVTSITDPRGYQTTYQYDNFGRLKFVKDADGHILEENKYHYRTQTP